MAFTGPHLGAAKCMPYITGRLPRTLSPLCEGESARVQKKKGRASHVRRHDAEKVGGNIQPDQDSDLGDQIWGKTEQKGR
jgi:hypothetical protein